MYVTDTDFFRHFSKYEEYIVHQTYSYDVPMNNVTITKNAVILSAKVPSKCSLLM